MISVVRLISEKTMISVQAINETNSPTHDGGH